MGTYKRLPRGKKKPTDEITTFAEKAYAWVLHKWRVVALVGGAVILIAAVVIAGHKYSEWRATKSIAALASAKEIDDVSKRNIALEEVWVEYGRTAAGREALLIVGKSALERAKFQDAAKWFEMLVARSRGYPILKVYALHNLGRAHWELENWEAAAKVFGMAALVKGNLLKKQSLYDQARCLEKMKKYDQARTIYDQILLDSEDVDPNVQEKSEERLLWLMAHQQPAE